MAADHQAFTCVATLLAPGVAITAAHCLAGHERGLVLSCDTVPGVAAAQTARVTRQARHPSHDVAVLHLRATAICEGGRATIAHAITAADRFQVVVPRRRHASGATSTTHNRGWRPAPVTRGAHTIDVLDDGACLAKGDSGTPLLIERQRGVNVLAGLLIGGVEPCRGPQTFVRLDRLRGWIMAQTREHE